jgi:hypothetical protein
MLAEDAIKAAVKDYEAKRASAIAGTAATAWFLPFLEWWKKKKTLAGFSKGANECIARHWNIFYNIFYKTFLGWS